MIDANGPACRAAGHVPLRVLVFQAPQERSQGQLAEEKSLITPHR